ncbi:MAG: urea carboxylase-associated family protein [Thaumarchaeota archaeon]|nr:urea carboxylase-associated family protein [Nitrososphaerota archaeon]
MTASVLQVPAGRAIAFRVKSGKSFRVIDIQGGQVADLIALNEKDLSEKLDQSRTRINNWKYRISVGDSVYSNKNNPMLRILEDKVGIHDLTFPGCSTFAYEKILKVGKRDGCIENLTEALFKKGVDLRTFEIPAPFSLFMDVEYDMKSNSPVIKPAASKPGDYIDLRSEMDCLVAVSSCADDVTDCNHGKVKPLEIRFLPSVV